MSLGFDHILDIGGYDHMLFLVALCAVYTTKEWRKLLLLVTAFTIGHSLTLALSVLDIISIPTVWVEWLIPLTIVLTALYDIMWGSSPNTGLRYMIALLFGTVHGLGFSNFLKSMFFGSSDVLLPLFSFNIGLEIGQIIFVVLLMSLSYLLVSKAKMPPAYWSYGLSAIALVVAGYMVVDRWPLT